MRPDRYIGVTGFVTGSEVSAALRTLDGLPTLSPTRLMVGVLASSKTLKGQPNKYPNRYPDVRTIAQLFPAHRRTVNLIHYSTDEKDTLPEQIEQLLHLGGRDLDGFQFNVCWPHPHLIKVSGGKRVVLQLGSRALGLANNTPRNVALMLDDYTDGTITDVLIDSSAGRGIPIDIEKAEEYVAAIAMRHPNLGIGIAGGLSNDNLDSIKGIIKQFPFLSIDAEGRLRAPEDYLYQDVMQHYLATADNLWDY